MRPTHLDEEHSTEELSYQLCVIPHRRKNRVLSVVEGDVSRRASCSASLAHLVSNQTGVLLQPENNTVAE